MQTRHAHLDIDRYADIKDPSHFMYSLQSISKAIEVFESTLDIGNLLLGESAIRQSVLNMLADSHGQGEGDETNADFETSFIQGRIVSTQELRPHQSSGIGCHDD